jgi:hypothetical protein
VAERTKFFLPLGEIKAKAGSRVKFQKKLVFIAQIRHILVGLLSFVYKIEVLWPRKSKL